MYVTYAGHFAEVNAVAWSPDSSQLASGGADGTVQVWEAATGLLLFTYHGHAGGVNTVAWHGSRIASGGADGTVQVWSFGRADATARVRTLSGARVSLPLQGDVLVYRGHAGPVTSVTWSPDGQRIASGSEDGTVQLWQAI